MNQKEKILNFPTEIMFVDKIPSYFFETCSIKPGGLEPYAIQYFFSHVHRLSSLADSKLICAQSDQCGGKHSEVINLPVKIETAQHII